MIMAPALAVAFLQVPASQSLPCYAVLALIAATQLLAWKDRRRRKRRLGELEAEIAALPSGHPDRGLLNRVYQRLKAADARPGDPEYEPVFDLRPAITRPAQEIPRRERPAQSG